MPCYFNTMVRNYFVSDDSEADQRIDDLGDNLELRKTLLFDFINSTVYHFGPPSYEYNTPNINKINFQTWKHEVYAIMTNDIDISDMTNLELDKCNMFWTAMEEQDLWDGYIIAESVEKVFNNSPVTYQRHYIEVLEIENNVQPHADNIEFESDEELSDHDYLSESDDDEYTQDEALDNINNMSSEEEEGLSEAETVIADYDDEYNVSGGESDVETDTDTDYEEAANNLIDEEAMNIINQFIQCATNNDPAALMMVIQTMQNYTQRSNTSAL